MDSGSRLDLTYSLFSHILLIILGFKIQIFRTTLHRFKKTTGKNFFSIPGSDVFPHGIKYFCQGEGMYLSVISVRLGGEYMSLEMKDRTSQTIVSSSMLSASRSSHVKLRIPIDVHSMGSYASFMS